MSTIDVPIESAGALQAERAELRGELVRELLASKLFLIGAFILLVWIVCAIFGTTIAPHSPYAQNLEAINKAPSGAHLFGTDQLGRDMFSRVIVGSRDIMIIVPLATILGTVAGSAVGLVMGYFRGATDEVISRFVEAFLAIPLVVTGDRGDQRPGALQPRDHPRDRDRVHAADRPHGPGGGAARARARLRFGRPPSRRARPLHHVRRDPPERDRADPGRVHGAARIRRVHGRDAVVPRLRDLAALARLGARDRHATTARSERASGGRCCSTRWRSLRW